MKKPEFSQHFTEIDAGSVTSKISVDLTSASSRISSETYEFFSKFDKDLASLVKEHRELIMSVIRYRNQYRDYLDNIANHQIAGMKVVQIWSVADLGFVSALEELNLKIDAKWNDTSKRLIKKLQKYKRKGDRKSSRELKDFRSTMRFFLSKRRYEMEDAACLRWLSLVPTEALESPLESIFRHYQVENVREFLLAQQKLLKRNDYLWESSDFRNTLRIFIGVLEAQEVFEEEYTRNSFSFFLYDAIKMTVLDEVSVPDEYPLLKDMVGKGADLLEFFKLFFDQLLTSFFNQDELTEEIITFFQLADQLQDSKFIDTLVDVWVLNDLDEITKFDYVNTLFWFKDMHEKTQEAFFLDIAERMYVRVTTDALEDMFLLNSDSFNKFVDYDCGVSASNIDINQSLDFIKTTHSRAIFDWTVDENDIPETIWKTPFNAKIDLDIHSMTVELSLLFTQKNKDYPRYSKITIVYDLAEKQAYFQFFGENELTDDINQLLFVFLSQVIEKELAEAEEKKLQIEQRRSDFEASTKIDRVKQKNNRFQRRLRRKSQKKDDGESRLEKAVEDSEIVESEIPQPITPVEKLRSHHFPTYLYVTTQIDKELKKAPKKGQKFQLYDVIISFLESFNQREFDDPSIGSPKQVIAVSKMNILRYKIGKVRFFALPIGNSQAVIFDIDSRNDVYKDKTRLVKRLETKAARALDNYVEFEPPEDDQNT